HTRFSRDWSSDVCSSDLGRDNITAIVVELSAPLTPEGHHRIWPIYEVARTSSLFQGLADLELATVVERVQVLPLQAGEALVRDKNGRASCRQGGERRG